jgi:hypothetical protein
LQLSFVQPLLSLQSGAAPPTHVPPLHASFVVQALPSLHGPACGSVVQPDAGLHKSAVQGLLSLQVIAVLWHEPALHVSVVQALLSVQVPALATQLVVQQSSFDPLPSSQASPASRVPLPHGLTTVMVPFVTEASIGSPSVPVSSFTETLTALDALLMALLATFTEILATVNVPSGSPEVWNALNITLQLGAFGFWIGCPSNGASPPATGFWNVMTEPSPHVTANE